MIHARSLRGLFWFRTFAILILLCGVSLGFEVRTTPQVSVSNGATVELPCQTSMTDVSVYWYYGNTVETATTLVVNFFKGKVIPRRDNVDMKPDFTLRIIDVGVVDSGVYVCKIVPSPFEGALKSSSTVLDVTANPSTVTIRMSSTSSTVATTARTTLSQQKTIFSTLSTETPSNTTPVVQETRHTTLGRRERSNATTSAYFEGLFVANQHVFTEGFIEVSSTTAPTTTMTTKSRPIVKSDSDKIQVNQKDYINIMIIVAVIFVVSGVIGLIVCYMKRSKRNEQNTVPDVHYEAVPGQTNLEV